MSDQTFPFPLFHGSSTHYSDTFLPGRAVVPWPHKDAALQLLRDVSAALRASGVEPDWWFAQAVEQATGPSNWQHGELYVSPSRISAVRYAKTGAEHGGELMTMCRFALNQFKELHPSRMKQLLSPYDSLGLFLEGGGRPLLVEFDRVRFSAVVPEAGESRFGAVEVAEVVNGKDDEYRDVLCQQFNFRLELDFAIVSRVHLLPVEDGDPNRIL